MSNEIICALLSLAGSGIGAVVGIAVNTKLSNYRISQLEAKVDRHNNLIERMYKAESNIKVLDEKMKSVSERVSEMEFSARD